jgi:hypothetical protein
MSLYFFETDVEGRRAPLHALQSQSMNKWALLMVKIANMELIAFQDEGRAAIGDS